VTPLTIENDGPAIVASDFWTTDQARAGKFFISCNEGAFRLLLPPQTLSVVEDMRTARIVEVRREGKANFRIIFEDDSDSPFVIDCLVNSFDRIPADTDHGGQFRFTVWTAHTPEEKPSMLLDLPATYIVEKKRK